MVDPWRRVLEMLSGAFLVPVVQWPTERTRLVIGFDDEADEQEIDLPSDEPGPRRARAAAVEDVLLQHLASVGTGSVRSAAAALSMPRQTVWRGFHRMQAQGRVRLGDQGWSGV